MERLISSVRSGKASSSLSEQLPSKDTPDPEPPTKIDRNEPQPDRFTFQACPITDWKGRYSRIPGDGSVFHVRMVDGRSQIVIDWCRDECTAACLAIDSSSVRKLIQAVLAAKRKLGGGGGGSFQINEFGQVLVPASDGRGRIALAGEAEGLLLFHNPFEDATHLDLSSCSGLKAGAPWPLPYVGIPYHLSARSKIYFYRQTDDGGRSEYPALQDMALIGFLRAIRRSGAVKFIVNPYGLVLTKIPPEGAWVPEEKWEAVFVGRINRRQWFKKEA